MRSRNLNLSFFKNEQIGSLPFADRLLFQGLWCLSDREGYFEIRPRRIAAEIFPYDRKIDENEIIEMLKRLMSVHVIICQDMSVKEITCQDMSLKEITCFGYIKSFLKYNKPHPHDKKSIVPENIKKILINQASIEDVRKCHDMSENAAVESGILNVESGILNVERKAKPIDELEKHVREILNIPMSYKKETEKLLKQNGLDVMIAAVDRMGRYFEHVKFSNWKEKILGRHWENLFKRLGDFMTDEALNQRLENTAKWNNLGYKDKSAFLTIPGKSEEDYKLRLEIQPDLSREEYYR